MKKHTSNTSGTVWYHPYRNGQVAAKLDVKISNDISKNNMLRIADGIRQVSNVTTAKILIFFFPNH